VVTSAINGPTATRNVIAAVAPDANVTGVAIALPS
jgi:hypothetical protein